MLLGVGKGCDILHIDNDADIRKEVERHARIQDLIYRSVESLKGLQDYLANDGYAGVFLIGGTFPESRQGPSMPLASSAEEKIHEKYPGANIVLHCSDPVIVHGVEEVFPVRRDIHPQQLVARIKEMIDEC